MPVFSLMRQFVKTVLLALVLLAALPTLNKLLPPLHLLMFWKTSRQKLQPMSQPKRKNFLKPFLPHLPEHRKIDLPIFMINCITISLHLVQILEIFHNFNPSYPSPHFPFIIFLFSSLLFCFFYFHHHSRLSPSSFFSFFCLCLLLTFASSAFALLLLRLYFRISFDFCCLVWWGCR